MAVVALLLAFTVGAVAAPTMSVFRFITLLTTLFMMAILAVIAMFDDTGKALTSVIALFASAQVGYGLGLAALARLDGSGERSRRRRPRGRK